MFKFIGYDAKGWKECVSIEYATRDQAVAAAEKHLLTKTITGKTYKDIGYYYKIEGEIIKALTPVPVAVPTEEELTRKEQAPFFPIWDRLMANIKAGNFKETIKALTDLTYVFIKGEKIEGLTIGIIPIGPTGPAAGSLIGTIGKFLLKSWSKIIMLGATAYGIAFGNEWFAKEGLIEQVAIPLSDLMRNYRYKPDPETLENIKSYYKKYQENVKTAETMIKTWSWLWPFTRGNWLKAIESYKLDVEERGKEISKLEAAATGKGIPEKVKVAVRDIIDGDTIDVALNAVNLTDNSSFQLPEYGTTGHARIRIVGINAPEKSPKGEILCSDVEIFKVEGKFADASRTRLMTLNDKDVTLMIDPNIIMDVHSRILAVVEFSGVDIGLRQIKEGLACGYYREEHKYVDKEMYKNETLAAQKKGIGMWPPVEVPPVKVLPVEVVPKEEIPTPPTPELIKATEINLFEEMKTFYVGRMYMSKKELAALLKKFDVSDIQSFIDEINTYYIGRMYLSKKEMIELGKKHNLDILGL